MGGVLRSAHKKIRDEGSRGGKNAPRAHHASHHVVDGQIRDHALHDNCVHHDSRDYNDLARNEHSQLLGGCMGHLCDRLGRSELRTRCNLFSKPLSFQQVSKQRLVLLPISLVSSLTSLVVLAV